MAEHSACINFLFCMAWKLTTSYKIEFIYDYFSNKTTFFNVTSSSCLLQFKTETPPPSRYIRAENRRGILEQKLRLLFVVVVYFIRIILYIFTILSKYLILILIMVSFSGACFFNNRFRDIFFCFHKKIPTAASLLTKQSETTQAAFFSKTYLMS